MVRATLTTAALLVLGLGVVQAQSAPAGKIDFTAESKLWVEGGSTVKAYKCVAKTIDADLQTGPEGASAPVASLVRKATVAVATAELECGNGTMNEHMRKALKEKENARIEFTLDNYVLDGTTAKLNGQLQIAGTTKPITFTATVTEEGGPIRVKASQAINMKDWGVKPPSLMMGTMKVKELVTIHFDVTLDR